MHFSHATNSSPHGPAFMKRQKPHSGSTLRAGSASALSKLSINEAGKQFAIKAGSVEALCALLSDGRARVRSQIETKRLTYEHQGRKIYEWDQTLQGVWRSSNAGSDWRDVVRMLALALARGGAGGYH